MSMVGRQQNTIDVPCSAGGVQCKPQQWIILLHLPKWGGGMLEAMATGSLEETAKVVWMDRRVMLRNMMLATSCCLMWEWVAAPACWG